MASGFVSAACAGSVSPSAMTLDPAANLAAALRAYSDIPLDAGDAVLLLDGKVAMQVDGLADQWYDQLRRNTVKILRETARHVVVAIARPGADLGPRDYQLWRDLHQDLAPQRRRPAAGQGAASRLRMFGPGRSSGSGLSESRRFREARSHHRRRTLSAPWPWSCSWTSGRRSYDRYGAEKDRVERIDAALHGRP